MTLQEYIKHTFPESLKDERVFLESSEWKEIYTDECGVFVRVSGYNHWYYILFSEPTVLYVTDSNGIPDTDVKSVFRLWQEINEEDYKG